MDAQTAVVLGLGIMLAGVLAVTWSLWTAYGMGRMKGIEESENEGFRVAMLAIKQSQEVREKVENEMDRVDGASAVGLLFSENTGSNSGSESPTI